jgi:plasmid stabilization system protein ParE
MKQSFRAEEFNADFDAQHRWYLEQAGEDVAKNFLNAVVTTLRSLAARPDLGRPRKFRNPTLRNLRSLPLAHPFNRILIFYRPTGDGITAWRLMDGARDLPRRLAEPPI